MPELRLGGTWQQTFLKLTDSADFTDQLEVVARQGGLALEE